MSLWLNRFSDNSSREPTPSATPRSFSPAPRRSIQLSGSTLPRRPGIQPRTSSLSINSLAGSTESLPAAARVPNGTNLKAQLAGSLPAGDPRDPLHVLESIVGLDGHDEEESDLDHAANAQEIELGSMSLEEFANVSLESSPVEEKCVKEITVIHDFEKEKDRFEDLHKSIAACDEVLKSVESYLTSFQAELASVSSEIESLQNRSTTLNNKLDTRKAVERVLGPEVEAFSIPPAVVRKLTEGAIDDQWIKSLHELERRSKQIDLKIKEGKDIKAAQDVKPFINDVSTKAVERIRDYVVAQIKALRSPSINAQIIQQNSFLKYKDVFAFLQRQQPQLGEEISQAYMNTMRWYYSHNFARYKAALEKLHIHVIDQTEVMAAEGGVRRGGKTGVSHDAFSIGRRMDILGGSNEVAMPSFAAEDDQGTHYLEVPFRAMNLALVDNACAEYSFLTEFFSKQQSFHATNRKFNEIFSPTFELGQSLTKQLIETSHDALGVLTCVRLTQHYAFELQRRKVPVAESYINGTNMLLWPRFQQIIDAHCDSIRKATAALSGKPAGSALSLTSSPASAQTTAPHPLTQRFANFLQGILALSREAGDDEPVSKSVGRLRGEFEAFLVKMSKGVAEARKRERFLLNNYALICTIIGDTEGKLADEARSHFEELRDALNVES
ncbi:hypothetical protein AC579_4927 [Pseudocercospora musae]|uniref:Uncharacterized protein n=1 Tax=Pseudocercospora musae TaxID=113226 RepID=A0A139I247_9PEZI|nr:hypothetical protein AC579_4927 [Pseudocercospora musae]